MRCACRLTGEGSHGDAGCDLRARGGLLVRGGCADDAAAHHGGASGHEGRDDRATLKAAEHG